MIYIYIVDRYHKSQLYILMWTTRVHQGGLTHPHIVFEALTECSKARHTLRHLGITVGYFIGYHEKAANHRYFGGNPKKINQGPGLSRFDIIVPYMGIMILPRNQPKPFLFAGYLRVAILWSGEIEFDPHQGPQLSPGVGPKWQFFIGTSSLIQNPP